MTPDWSEGMPGFDPTVPNEARMLDYFMGGKDNFAADREAAELALKLAPELPMMCREARKFLGRTVRFLAGAGIRQSVDIGCGLPTQGNVHEILRPVAPEAKVAYIDIDPLVVVHSRALIEASGPVQVILADAREPDRLLDHPELASFIDLRQPVAVLLHSLLAVIPEDDVATMIVKRLTARMAAGSYLLLSHAISDHRPEATRELSRLYQERNALNVQGDPRPNLRTRIEVERFMDGFPAHPARDGAAACVEARTRWSRRRP